MRHVGVCCCSVNVSFCSSFGSSQHEACDCVLFVCVAPCLPAEGIVWPQLKLQKKRKDSSEDWGDFSANLATRNELPASVAKVNIEKPHQLAVQKLARFLAKAYAAMECHDTAVLPRAGRKVAQQYIEFEKEALQID